MPVCVCANNTFIFVLFYILIFLSELHWLCTYIIINHSNLKVSFSKIGVLRWAIIFSGWFFPVDFRSTPHNIIWYERVVLLLSLNLFYWTNLTIDFTKIIFKFIWPIAIIYWKLDLGINYNMWEYCCKSVLDKISNFNWYKLYGYLNSGCVLFLILFTRFRVEYCNIMEDSWQQIGVGVLEKSFLKIKVSNYGLKSLIIYDIIVFICVWIIDFDKFRKNMKISILFGCKLFMQF